MRQRRIAMFTSAVLLMPSWMLMFWVVTGPVTWSLTPYDSTPILKRPPFGSWPRLLNDFFDTLPGNLMPAVLIVGISVSFFVVALRSLPDSPTARIRLMLLFGLSNLAAIAGIAAGAFIVGPLPLELAPYPGYGWTAKFLIADLLCVALLLAFQWSRIRHTASATPDRRR